MAAQLEHWIGCDSNSAGELMMPDLQCLSSWGTRVCVGLVLEHVGLFFHNMIASHVSGVPEDVQLARDAQDNSRAEVCVRARATRLCD